jgi:WD40 repeat protein
MMLPPIGSPRMSKTVRRARRRWDCCAHGQGLIHRDVKPSNLMLDQHGQVKVLDLGLALLQTDDSKSGETTFSGQMMGTADYMAPEQINDAHEVDARADIYSLGCTLYAMLTGHPPFNGQGRHGSHVAKILAHLEQEPVPVRDLCADVPPKLATLLQRMMAKKPENRLATATEVAEALRPFCKGADLPALLARALTAKEAGKPTPADSPPLVDERDSAQTAGQRRRPIWTVVAVAAAFFIMVALGVIIRIRYRDGRETVIQAPDDAQIVIQRDADSLAAAATSSDGGPGKQIPTIPTTPVRIERELVARKPGDPLSAMALAIRPAAIPGIESWTMETGRHRGPINSLAIHPTGQWLASGGADGTIRIWNPLDLQLSRILVGHGGNVNAVVWSPDGCYLASASDDGTVRIWSPATGQLLRVLRGHEREASGVAWSADGKQLISVGLDKTLRLWDAATGAHLLSLAGDCVAHAVACSGNGKYIASEIEDKVIAIREFDSRKVVQRLPADGSVTDIDFSPDSSMVVAADLSGVVKLWDVNSWKLVEPAPKFPPATRVAFGPDGARLATAGADGVVRVWELASGGMICESKTAGDAITAVTWAADSRSIVSAASQSKVAMSVTDTSTGDVRAEATGHFAEMRLVSPTSSPDGNRVALWSSVPTPTSLVVLPTTLDVAPTTLAQPFYIRTIAWSPDGKLMAASDVLKTAVHLIDIQTGTIFRSIAPPPEVQTSPEHINFAWAPDGTKLVISYGSTCKEAHLYEASSGTLLRKFEAPGTWVGAIAYSPDGKSIAASDRRSAWIWNAETGDEEVNIPPVPDCPEYISVVWSANSGFLALGTGYGCQIVKRSGEGTQWLPFPGSGEAPCRFFAEDDSVFIATRLQDAFCWDIATGSRTDWHACLSPRSHQTTNLMGGVAPTRDGRWVISTAGDNIVRFIAPRSGRLQAAIMFLASDLQTALAFNQEGHCRVIGNLNDDILYVAETESGQETLTSDAFSQRFGWKNDPNQVTLAPATTSSQPNKTGTHSEPTAKPGDQDALKIEPEPIDIQPGQPLSGLALTVAPAAIERAKSWTLETAGHRGGVRSVAYSPNGRFLATASDDGVVRLWDAVTNSFVRALIGHEAGVRALAWSPDSQFLASGSADKTIVLWDVAQGRRLRVLRGHVEMVNTLGWSPDGRVLASGCEDATICLWEVERGNSLRVLRGHTGPVRSLAWSPDGKILLSGGGDTENFLWDPSSSEQPRQLEDAQGRCHAVARRNDHRHGVCLGNC